MKLASIDIGSNAARLLIAEIKSPTDYSKLNLLRIPLQLGFDVFETGQISPAKKEVFIKTMKVFKDLMDIYKVQDFRICATSAMRDAQNASEITHEIKELTELEIEVISGDEEASILYENHLSSNLHDQPFQAFVDVGGGSTEITLYGNQKLIKKHSFNIGTIRILNDHSPDEEWQKMKEFCKTHLKSQPFQLIGSGGNINKIFSMSKTKEGEPVSLNFIKKLHQNLSKLSLDQRIAQFNLRSDRANVIVPALHIYSNIMKWGACKEIFVPKIGLADGIVKKLYADKYHLK
jgi:exopolyphosphatase/guanosine-5'-triphosphate,3'-diphosphate pyrophosphatase